MDASVRVFEEIGAGTRQELSTGIGAKFAAIFGNTTPGGGMADIAVWRQDFTVKQDVVTIEARQPGNRRTTRSVERGEKGGERLA